MSAAVVRPRSPAAEEVGARARGKEVGPVEGMREVVVGVDAGTTAVKTVVWTPTGRVLGLARSTVRVRRPGAARAEQDMDELWSAVAETIRAALAEAGDVVVLGIGVTGQGDGAWLVDAAGRPVGPCATWLDGRAGARVARWEADGRAALVRRVTGSAVFPGALPLLLEQLEADDPLLLHRAAAHLNCKDWIRYRLTGVMATDHSEASRTYLDVTTGEYSTELLAGLGHERFARLLPPVRRAEEVVGHVLPGVARETGLPAGAPVATGMVDTPAGGLGLGVVAPGDAYAIVGTTAFVGTLHERPTMPLGTPGITLSTGPGAPVVECLAPMNGTPNLDWARAVLGEGGSDWADVERLAREAGPGAGGVLHLPYASTSGERAPFVDVHATGGWLGTTVRTTPGELLRAVYEGVALSLRECLDALAITGELRMCGGAASSDLVCQVVADVTGRTVVRPSAVELGTRGVAALVLVALGRAPDRASALAAFGDEVVRFAPDPAVAPLHEQQSAVFRAVRDAVRPHWPAMAAVSAAARAAAEDQNTPRTTVPTEELA